MHITITVKKENHPKRAETRIAELEAEIEQETRSLMSAGLHPSQR